MNHPSIKRMFGIQRPCVNSEGSTPRLWHFFDHCYIRLFVIRLFLCVDKVTKRQKVKFAKSYFCMKIIPSIVPLLSVSSMVVVASNKVLHQDREVLPATSTWPHRPVWLQAGDDTRVLGHSGRNALPLGVPVEFETDLFKGKMLLRLRHAKSDDPGQHKAYFDGRKRLMQTVVQGKFKKPVSMSDVYVGSVFKKPLEQVPPPFFTRMMNSIMKRVAPGVIFDLDSPKPRVVALYAGTAQSISIDVPGEEPDISGVDLPENLVRTFGSKFKSIHHRKKKLSLPQKASKYQFDTEHVYTFHSYDEKMDYGTYSISLPVYGDYNISKALGPQPMTLSAVTGSGDTVYSFDLWHESVYELQ